MKGEIKTKQKKEKYETPKAKAKKYKIFSRITNIEEPLLLAENAI